MSAASRSNGEIPARPASAPSPSPPPRRPSSSAKVSAIFPIPCVAAADRLTGQVGYAIPSSASSDTSILTAGSPNRSPPVPELRRFAAVQHAVPQIDRRRPRPAGFLNHLIPIVEAQFQTPVANYLNTGIGTTGNHQSGRHLGRTNTSRSASRRSFRSIAPAAPASARWRNSTSISTTCSRPPSASRSSAAPARRADVCK